MAQFKISVEHTIYRNDTPTFSLTGINDTEIKSLLWYYRSSDLEEIPFLEPLKDSAGNILYSTEDDDTNLQLDVFLSSEVVGNTYSLTYQFTDEITLKNYYQIGYILNGQNIIWPNENNTHYIYMAPIISAPVISLQTVLPAGIEDIYKNYYAGGDLKLIWNYPSTANIPNGWNLQYELKLNIITDTSIITQSYGSGTVGTGVLELSNMGGNQYKGSTVNFYIVVTSLNDDELELISNVSNNMTKLKDFSYQGGQPNIQIATESTAIQPRIGVNLRPNYYKRYIDSSLTSNILHPTEYFAFNVSSEHPCYAEAELGYKYFTYKFYFTKSNGTKIELTSGQLSESSARITNEMIAYYQENLDSKWNTLFDSLDSDIPYSTQLIIEFKDLYNRTKQEQFSWMVDFREAPFPVTNIKIGRNPVKNDINHKAPSSIGYFPNTTTDTDLRLVLSDEYFVIAFNENNQASYAGDTKVNRKYTIAIYESSDNGETYNLFKIERLLTTAVLKNGVDYGLENSKCYQIKATNLTDGRLYKASIQVHGTTSQADNTSSIVYSSNPVLIGYNANNIVIDLQDAPSIGSEKTLVFDSSKIEYIFPSVETNPIYGYERSYTGYTKNIKIIPQWSVDMDTWQDSDEITTTGNYPSIIKPNSITYTGTPSMVYVRFKLIYNRRLQVINDEIEIETTTFYSNTVVTYLDIATISYRKNRLGINTTSLENESILEITDHDNYKNLVLKGSTEFESEIINTTFQYNLGTGILSINEKNSLIATVNEIINLFN